MRKDQIFVLLLIILVPMSGCFDNAVGEVDATDEAGQEGTTSDSAINPSTLTTNIAPIVSAYLDTNVWAIEGSDCTTSAFGVYARHAMTDWNDNISSAGWDVNLDGIIDYPVTMSEGYTELEINLSEMVIKNLTIPTQAGSGIYAEKFVVFGAVDTFGVWSSSSLMKVEKYIGFYNRETDTYVSYIDQEPCPDFTDVTDYEFSVVDHADIASGYSDYLVTISRTNGQSGIDWSRIAIYFDGSDEGNERCYSGYYRCDLLDGDGLSNSSLGTMWDAGQSVTIRESDTNLHDNGQEAEIEIYIDNILVFSQTITVN